MLGSKRVKPTIYCIYHKPWPPPFEQAGRISSTFCCNFMTSSILNSGTPSSPRTPSSLITFFQKSSLIGLERSLAVSWLRVRARLFSLLLCPPCPWTHEMNWRHGNMPRDRTMATDLVKGPLLKRLGFFFLY